ncbi:hypothetical protein HUU62_13390 [Rhodoferax sp. 4810]|nr:hypothetical protein [Rhodoferax jenense]
MKPNLKCVVGNQIKRWKKNGLLHREDGPAVIRGSGDTEVREYWFEGCLVSEAMLELHKTLTPEVDEILRKRKVIKIDSCRSFLNRMTGLGKQKCPTIDLLYF